MFTDSSSGIAATRNQRVTSMSRHIARHWYYVRQGRQAGHIQLLHIDGDRYQLADLGTKNIPAAEALYKLSIIETSILEEGSIVARAREAPTAVSLDLSPMAQSKRGVGNPSGVPGKSHVCSNSDETVPQNQECPSLVPCGPKVGRRYSAAFLRGSVTTGSTPEAECNRGITSKSTHNAQTRLLFKNCQTSQKITFRFSVKSRMPYFGAMWPKSR